MDKKPDHRMKKVKSETFKSGNRTYFLTCEEIREILEELGLETTDQLCDEFNANGCTYISSSNINLLDFGCDNVFTDGYLFFF